MDPQKAEMSVSASYLAPQIVFTSGDTSEEDDDLSRKRLRSFTADESRGKGLFRSFSDRRNKKQAAKAKDGETGQSDSESTLTRSGSMSWSFRGLRNSFRRKKKERDEETVAAPQVPSTQTTPSLSESEKKKTFKKFLWGTMRRKKKSSTQLFDTVPSPTSDGLPASPSQLEPQRSSFFKSKKGKHLWASRVEDCRDNVALTAIHVDKMLDAERLALQSYAVEHLGFLLHLTVQIPDDSEALAEELSGLGTVAGSPRRGFFRRLSKKQSPTPVSSSPGANSPSMNSFTPRRTSADGAPETSCVFNRALEKLLEEDRLAAGDASLTIPRIARTSIDFLARNSCNARGIFRVSGSARRIRQLNEAFDAGEEADFSNCSPNDVASVLKYFLRNLPEPLLTHALYPCFLRVAELKVDEQLLALRLLCALLPPANRALLHALLTLLNMIADAADEPDGTCMNSRNLALVLAPNLLMPKLVISPAKGSLRKQPSMDDSAELAMAEGDTCDIIETMIDLSEHLFVVPPELRDAVLGHHQLVAPSVVDTVLSQLIRHAARSRDTQPVPVSQPVLVPEAAESPLLLARERLTLQSSISNKGMPVAEPYGLPPTIPLGCSAASSPGTPSERQTDDHVSYTSPQTSVHSPLIGESPVATKSPPSRGSRSHSSLLNGPVISQEERPLPPQPLPRDSLPLTHSYPCVNGRSPSLSEPDVDGDDEQDEDGDLSDERQVLSDRGGHRGAPWLRPNLADSPLSDLTKLWDRRAGGPRLARASSPVAVRRIAESRGSPGMARRQASPSHSQQPSEPRLDPYARRGLQPRRSTTLTDRLPQQEAPPSQRPPQVAPALRSSLLKSGSIVLDPERGPVLVLGEDMDDSVV